MDSLLLQGLIWALIFVFALFGFIEAYIHAPGSWWLAHGGDYWILLAGGLLCLPAFHGVAWLAERADSRIRRAAPGAPAPARRFLDHVGGLTVWGLWLGALAGATGAFEVAPPETAIPAALLSFSPVELRLWALACGLGGLTLFAVFDQIRGRDGERGIRALLLHLACYVWFYAAAGEAGAGPAGGAWLIPVLAAAQAAPMAWLMARRTPRGLAPADPRRRRP